MKKLLITMSMILLLPATVSAQSPDRSKQQLIDELKQLTEKAERDRSASYRFLDQLREVISRHDQPWRRRVLFDDFRDGELQRNPTWYSNSQNFWVTRSIGLRTDLREDQRGSSPSNHRSTEEALLGMILEGVMQNPNQQPRERSKNVVRADISTAATIDNAFSITLQLASLGRDRGGSFEWGIYQGNSMESGYRLVYEAGARPKLKLLAYRRGMSSVIEQYDQGSLLEDGNSHKIIWQRTADGSMRVSIDGRQLMQVRDRTYRNHFSGFVMTNRGGEYGIRSITILSANE